MWEMKVWTPNKKQHFIIKTETLEDMSEFREASLRMGYITNKKCFWKIQSKMER